MNNTFVEKLTPDSAAKTFVSPLTYESQAVPSPHSELRKHTRYMLTCPVLAIPVLADGSPDVDNVLDGLTIDISMGGVGLELRAGPSSVAETMVIGLEAQDGSMRFATAATKYVLEAGIGVRVGARFYPPEKDLLRPEKVTPCFDPKTFYFSTGMSNEALTKWGLMGVVRPLLLDWVQVCFQCESLLTFRRGCPACGSARAATSRLIHHFACAHVTFAADYEANGCLQCPKCRTKNLIVGADYEYLDGPFHCLDCSWHGTEQEPIAQCLRCRVRFPAHRAIEKELIGYHVCRLDPMDFVPPS